MKVLFQSYNNCMQNESGGISTKIKALYNSLLNNGINVKYFSKFEDKVKDYDVLHIFKANIENLPLIELANKNDVKVVISSTIPCTEKIKIIINLALCKYFPITTGIGIIQKSLQLADLIIAESLEEKNFISKYYKICEDKIEILPSGIDKDFIQRLNKVNIDRSVFPDEYVLCVGRFDENKNQLNLIKALKDTDITVVFIGGPTDNTIEYYEKCKAEANENMYFLGWINNNDDLLVSAYKNAKVVVLPSFYETFGISILEGAVAGANISMSSTLPISKYDILSSFLFDPNDTDDIKKSITLAYNAKKNIKQSKTVIDNFSWDKIAKQHIELYKSI